MRQLFISLLMTITFAVSAAAQNKEPQHLLDGTSANYYYQTGRAIHIEFYEGKLKYEWIAGPTKGTGSQDLAYQSRKIGDGIYVVNWVEEAHPDFITIIFNFNTNVMYSSGILRFGTDDQFVVFDGGILEDVRLVTKE